MAKTPRIQQMNVAQFEAAFPDDDACRAYLRDQRWPDGMICCPRCGSVKVYALKTMPFKWECMDCGQSTSYRFSVIAGTIFENTNKPLRQWFRVIHLMMTSKKGMSALQIQRYMGFGSYETAWSMCHKIRTALMDTEFQKLMGLVEVDETFIGGKIANKHKDKRGGPGGTGGGSTGSGGQGTGKQVVIGAVQRKGNVIARVIKNTDTATLDSFVREAVSTKVSLISTDEHSGYRLLKHDYRHGFVRHSRGEYVAGAIHTNTIEGFWSLIKRGIVGSYHKVSAKYLPLYVAEFQFRYNNRNNADIFRAAVAGC